MRSWTIRWVYSLVGYAQLKIFWQLRDFVRNYKGTIIQKLLNGFNRKYLGNRHNNISNILPEGPLQQTRQSNK
jgi:hypothetical protein